MEGITFVVFVVIQYATKTLPEWLEMHHKLQCLQKLAKHHWAVWLAHPAVLDGAREYVVHFVVYSGYVLKHV